MVKQKNQCIYTAYAVMEGVLFNKCNMLLPIWLLDFQYPFVVLVKLVSAAYDVEK